MEKNKNDMFERGYNLAFYLSEYAPQILARAMRGLKGEPKEFFEGLREGKAHSERLRGADERKQKEKDDKEYWKDYRNEKDKEARYQEKLKEDARKRKEEAEIEGRLLEREMRTDHVQKRLEELNRIRKREQEAQEKYPKIREADKEPEHDKAEQSKEAGNGRDSAGAEESVQQVNEAPENQVNEAPQEPATKAEERMSEIEQLREGGAEQAREQDSKDQSKER